VKRLAILIITVLIGAAAPARAWCEATCLAPVHQSDAEPHCPSHDDTSDRAALSATSTADCPVVESARPIPARLDLQVGSVSTFVPQHSAIDRHGRSAVPQARTWSVFERHVPLRI
jgi:hypothetical protein